MLLTIYSSNEIEKNAMGRACAIYAVLWWANMKGGDHFEDLDTDGRKDYNGLIEVSCEGLGRINLYMDTEKLWVLVSMELHFQVP